LLRCTSLLMDLSGRDGELRSRRQHSGVKRTRTVRTVAAAFDPKRTPSRPDLGELWGLLRVTKAGREWGLLPMSRSDEYRRFAAECLKIAHATEDEQSLAVFLKWPKCGWTWHAKTRQTQIALPVRRKRTNYLFAARCSASSASSVQATSISCNNLRSSSVLANWAKRRQSSANLRYCADGSM
jgi:hypothetical protein